MKSNKSLFFRTEISNLYLPILARCLSLKVLYSSLFRLQHLAPSLIAHWTALLASVVALSPIPVADDDESGTSHLK